jgi:hypothetical protein
MERGTLPGRLNWQSESITPRDLAHVRYHMASSQTIFIMKQYKRFLTRAGERDTLREADAWTAICIEQACRSCLHVRAMKGNRHEVERQRLEPPWSASY